MGKDRRATVRGCKSTKKWLPRGVWLKSRGRGSAQNSRGVEWRVYYHITQYAIAAKSGTGELIVKSVPLHPHIHIFSDVCIVALLLTHEPVPLRHHVHVGVTKP